ncbi:hypothetical protein Ancab_009606 [Ancistrocladus abbreviatus]
MNQGLLVGLSSPPELRMGTADEGTLLAMKAEYGGPSVSFEESYTEKRDRWMMKNDVGGETRGGGGVGGTAKGGVSELLWV